MPLTVCIIFLVVTFALLSLWFFIRAKVKRNVMKCEDKSCASTEKENIATISIINILFIINDLTVLSRA